MYEKHPNATHYLIYVSNLREANTNAKFVYRFGTQNKEHILEVKGLCPTMKMYSKKLSSSTMLMIRPATLIIEPKTQTWSQIRMIA